MRSLALVRLDTSTPEGRDKRGPREQLAPDALVENEAVQAGGAGAGHAARSLEVRHSVCVQRELIAMRRVAGRRARPRIVAVASSGAGIQEVSIATERRGRKRRRRVAGALGEAGGVGRDVVHGPVPETAAGRGVNIQDLKRE